MAKLKGGIKRDSLDSRTNWNYRFLFRTITVDKTMLAFKYTITFF